MAPAQRLDLGDLIRAAERIRDEVAAARRQSDRETRAVLRRQFDQTTDPERRQELRLLLDGRRTVTDLLRDPDFAAGLAERADQLRETMRAVQEMDPQQRAEWEDQMAARSEDLLRADEQAEQDERAARRDR